jgi:aldehyde dehydrogenase (NAD+)
MVEADVSGAARVRRLHEEFARGTTRPLEWRRGQLQAIHRLLRDRETDLVEAMRLDLGRPAAESWVTDLAVTLQEVKYALRHLDRWAGPEPVRVPLVEHPAAAKIVREPLGVVLVIAPWNYPIQLLIVPVIGALAAGNCVVAKPSEVAGHCAALIARLADDYLDSRCVAVVNGGVPATQELLAQRFDHIFFTGSSRVGRLVMEAASRHLTPVTLELGGKSPVIVDEAADLEVAARRIAHGKFLNAGQSCVAPDYVLVHRAVETALLERLVEATRAFYGREPRASADYGRIISDRHVQRLAGLLQAGGYDEIVLGGQVEPADRYVAPTILRRCRPDAAVMEDEIFGPILPVVAVDDVDAAIEFVNARPKPLALYLFSDAEPAIERVLACTSSGGVGINTTMHHMAVPALPFGGIGASGTGAYHGRWGFETFSHRKAVFTKATRPDLPLVYPPYKKTYTRIVRRLI